MASAYIEGLDEIKEWHTGRFRPDPHRTYFGGFNRTAKMLLKLGADVNAVLQTARTRRFLRAQHR